LTALSATRDNTVCIDLDDTLIPWSGSTKLDSKPFPGACEAVQRLRDAGYYIVIFTSRLSTEWLKTSPNNEVEMIISFLKENNIPWDRITAEKIPAIAYFDDRAVTISPRYPLETAIEEFLHA
jgi:hypothetical protein